MRRVYTAQTGSQASNDLAIAQVSDLVVGIAEFAQDVLGLLALLGNSRDDIRGVRDKVIGWPTTRTSPRSRIPDRNRDAQVLNLRVGKHLIHPVDRPRRYALGFQLCEPLRGRAVLNIGAIKALIAGRLRVRSAPFA